MVNWVQVKTNAIVQRIYLQIEYLYTSNDEIVAHLKLQGDRRSIGVQLVLRELRANPCKTPL